MGIICLWHGLDTSISNAVDGARSVLQAAPEMMGGNGSCLGSVVFSSLQTLNSCGNPRKSVLFLNNQWSWDLHEISTYPRCLFWFFAGGGGVGWAQNSFGVFKCSEPPAPRRPPPTTTAAFSWPDCEWLVVIGIRGCHIQVSTNSNTNH